MGLKTFLGLKRAHVDPDRHMRIDNWASASRRMKEGFFVPAFFPSFTMEPPGPVYTIGSCFARHIEESLSAAGFRVPVHEFSVPLAESKTVLGGATLNKFTPVNILQEIKWAESIFLRDGMVRESDCERYGYKTGSSVIDLMFGSYEPVSRGRFLERRQQIYDVAAHAFSAPYIIITPGLIEAWRDKETGFYVQATPFDRRNRINPDRFAFDVLDYPHSLACLQDTIATIKTHNAKAKFIVTTSPVPLGRTFRENIDIVVANAESKSILRAACAQISRADDAVDYFPSYEAVLTYGKDAFRDDMLHVNNDIVQTITGTMIAAYARPSNEP